MTTAAKWAYGTLLKIGDGESAETFTTLAEVFEISPAEMSRDAIDVTNHSSADGYKEFIPGLRDAGEYDVKMNWLPANATQDGSTGILAQFDDDDVHNYQLVLQDGTTQVAFSGFLTSFKPVSPIDAQYTLECKLKVTGKPVITTA